MIPSHPISTDPDRKKRQEPKLSRSKGAERAQPVRGLNKSQRRVYPIFYWIASILPAAAELIPSTRLADWTVGDTVGVVGGIKQYQTGGASARTVYSDANTNGITDSLESIDATGATDVASDIQSAVTAATSGTAVVLPAGTFRTNSTITIGQADDGVTLRGQGDSTIIDYRGGSGVAIFVGTTYAWNNPDPGDAVTAGVAIGSDTVTIASTSAYATGALINLAFEDQRDVADIVAGATPIINAFGANTNTHHVAKLVSKTSTTLTFHPPIVRAPDAGLSTTVTVGQWDNKLVGLENFKIIGTNTTMFAGVQIQQADNSWMDGVTIRDTNYYLVYVDSSPNCEIRNCDFRTRIGGGSNGAGILTNLDVGLLVEDNIVLDIFPVIEINGSTVGSVFGYNLFENTPVSGVIYTGVSSNHGPHNSYNLYEGNITPNFVSDGYFGGESEITLFRNWMHGSCYDSSAVTATHSWKRMTRNGSLVGNVVGKTSVKAGVFSYGQPNIGNGGSDGAATIHAEGSLTTRTSASAGTITGPSGHTVTTGNTIDLVWKTYDSFGAAGDYWTSHMRTGVTVGTVSGTSIPISGGTGDDLPPQDNAIYIPNTDPDLMSLWNDWGVTATLTTRTSDILATLTVDDGPYATAADIVAGYDVGVSASGSQIMEFRSGSSGDTQAWVSAATGVTVTLNHYQQQFFPAATTTGALWGGSTGYQELDLDVQRTTLNKGNYLYGTSGAAGSMSSLGGDTLPDSLYTSKAAMEARGVDWGALTYPPVDPTAPNSMSYESIPAGYRWVNNADPGGGGGTTITVGTLRIGAP